MLGLCLAMAEPGDPLAGGRIDESGKFIPGNPIDRAATAQSDLPDPAEWKAHAEGLIEDLGGGKYRLGKTLMDAGASTVTIPARINAHTGQVEYALVNRAGKMHEALLSTNESPFHIHLAALLVGLASPDQDAKPRAIEVLVEWDSNGPRRSHRIEDLIAMEKDGPLGGVGESLERGDWYYGGSSVNAQGFAAENEGSVIAIIGDPVALVNNPRPSGPGDPLSIPNAKILPAIGHPVSVILRPAAKQPAPNK